VGQRARRLVDARHRRGASARPACAAWRGADAAWQLHDNDFICAAKTDELLAAAEGVKE
jgi:hypothetical protein